MISVALEHQALRSATTAAARLSTHFPPPSHRGAPSAVPALQDPAAAALHQGAAPAFPDLSDPVVRALPISALAIAWAVLEQTGPAS